MSPQLPQARPDPLGESASEAFGNVLAARPATPSQVWLAWRQDHPQGTIVEFSAWAFQITGLELHQFCTESEIWDMAIETARDPALAACLIEGLDSWP